MLISLRQLPHFLQVLLIRLIGEESLLTGFINAGLLFALLLQLLVSLLNECLFPFDGGGIVIEQELKEPADHGKMSFLASFCQFLTLSIYTSLCMSNSRLKMLHHCAKFVESRSERGCDGLLSSRTPLAERLQSLFIIGQ